MAAGLREMLAEVASRIAASQERLRALEQTAAGLREELQFLCRELNPDGGQQQRPGTAEFRPRVPTRSLGTAAEGQERADETVAGDDLSRPEELATSMIDEALREP